MLGIREIAQRHIQNVYHFCMQNDDIKKIEIRGEGVICLISTDIKHLCTTCIL